MSIWTRVKPIDSTEPAAGAVTNPGMLKVNVIDPAVINVDWTVDGTTKVNGGTTFDTSTPGGRQPHHHGEGVRQRRDGPGPLPRPACPSSVTGSYCHRTAWKNSTQTVMWTFTK